MIISGEWIAFLILASIAIIGGILLINLRKVFHVVLALSLTFLSIAGIYVLLSAEFLATIQVLIYSGAITILFLFGIMLTPVFDEERKKINRWLFLVLIISVISFGSALYYGILQVDFGNEITNLHESNTEQIGIAMFTKYIIPFELVSILLLVALVGAIIISKKDDEEGATKK
jgi:NADH-quinone oxidoreductase subunit J